MSMVAQVKTQRRDKAGGGTKPLAKATAEQIRIAQLTNISDDESLLANVNQIMEVTGTTEDNARTALFDTDNDTNQAIELILEQGNQDQSSEWETARKRRTKPATSSVRGVDTFGEEVKNKSNDNLVMGTWGDSDTKGWNRGRGRSQRGGHNNDRGKSWDQKTDGDHKENTESRDRRGGRRGRGRGGSFSGRGRGGRGPRRFGTYNRGRGRSEGRQFTSSFDGGFDSFNPSNHNDTNKAAADDWGEDWGGLEVGTWTIDDVQKQQDKQTKPEATAPSPASAAPPAAAVTASNDVEEDQTTTTTAATTTIKSPEKNESGEWVNTEWGTCSWTDGLSETKVFKAQSPEAPDSPLSGALPPSTHVPLPPNNHQTPPQMGERIDIGTLFKKNYQGPVGPSIYSNNGSSQPSVIQQLQDPRQSSSLFSDSKATTDIESSRLFGSFVSSKLINSTTPSQSHPPPDTFSQFNGKVESSETGGSSLLGNFREQISSALNPPPDQAVDTASIASKNVSTIGVSAEYSSFSQAQQKEASDAVKASLGLPPAHNEQVNSTSRPTPPGTVGSPHPGQSLSPSTLSFGAPVIRQPKQSRRKQPPSSSKIPATPVEMPSAGNSGYHELGGFGLQFGIDDNASTVVGGNGESDFVSSNIVTSPNSLFSNSVATMQSSLINHLPSHSMSDSMFSSQLPHQQVETRGIQRSSYQSLQPQLSQGSNQIGSGRSPDLENPTSAPAASMLSTQRFPETIKSSETLRGPPGLSHPQVSTSSSSSASPSINGLGGVLSGNQTDSLSSSFNNSGNFGNMNINGLGGHETNPDPSSTIGRSYYTSASLPQPSKQVDMPGRNLRSPVPSSSLPGSLQASPMQHITGTPAKDPMSSAANISSLASGIAQTHITSRVVASPSKLPSSSTSNISGSISSSSTSLPISINSNTGGYGGPSSISSLSYSGTSLSGQSTSHVSSTVNKQLSSGEHNLYSSPGLLHHNHMQQQQTQQQQAQTVLSSSSNNSASVNSLGGSSTGVSHSSTSNAASKSISQSSVSKAAPPNLTLGVPPILPSQYGIPMGPGLMTAYTPEALYGYTDPLMAVQSRVVNQVPNYYDMPFHSTANPTATTSNRETNSSAGNQSTKFGRGEPSSPSSVMGMMNSGLQQPQVASGQHNPQLKVSQTASHQGGHFMNLPTAAAYPGYSGLYYNTFQYPPILVPQNAKHSVNVTSAFQPHTPGFANAYSSTASVNASSTNNSLHNMQVQDQSFGKSHVTLTAAMAAANNSGGAAGAAPGISPYTQTFMPMLPTHQPSQIHLHLQQQHGDLGQTVGPQRSQNSNQHGKNGNKGGGNFSSSSQYWGN